MTVGSPWCPRRYKSCTGRRFVYRALAPGELPPVGLYVAPRRGNRLALVSNFIELTKKIAAEANARTAQEGNHSKPCPGHPQRSIPVGVPIRADRADLVESHVRDLAESLGPGAILPGERELAASCGVSRMTVRRALDELATRRVVERRHGAGTYVRHPAAAQPLMATSFHEDMRRRGFAPSSRLVSAESETSDDALAAALEISTGEAVLVVRRLRLADDEPIGLETLHVPLGRVPGLTGGDLAEGSYYALLRERYGRRIASGRQLVRPVVPDDGAATLLGIAPGTAAFGFQRVSRDDRGEVVEQVDALYRADRYLIEIDILPPAEPRS